MHSTTGGTHGGTPQAHAAADLQAPAAAVQARLEDGRRAMKAIRWRVSGTFCLCAIGGLRSSPHPLYRVAGGPGQGYSRKCTARDRKHDDGAHASAHGQSAHWRRAYNVDVSVCARGCGPLSYGNYLLRRGRFSRGVWETSRYQRERQQRRGLRNRDGGIRLGVYSIRNHRRHRSFIVPPAESAAAARLALAGLPRQERPLGGRGHGDRGPTRWSPTRSVPTFCWGTDREQKYEW